MVLFSIIWNIAYLPRLREHILVNGIRITIVMLHESRVEPLIPARFGDFLEFRPGSTFDHKGLVGSRTGSEKEISFKRVNDLPNIKKNDSKSYVYV